MARTTAGNYANPGFQYATVDGDQFDRTDVAGVGQSLEQHDHTAGNGLAVARIAPGTVNAAAIADGTITTVKLGDGQVTSLKIADGTIVAADLADATLTQAKMANLSIGTAQLIDTSVTTAKIADANVTQSKLSTASVGTAQLIDGAVTSAKLASALAISGTLTVGGNPMNGTFASLSNISLTQSFGVSIIINYARWTQLGKFVYVEAYLSFAAAGGAAGNPINVNITGLPAAVNNLAYPSRGNFVYVRSGVSLYAGSVIYQGGGVVFACDGNAALLGQSPSFSIGASDVLSFSFSYEAS